MTEYKTGVETECETGTKMHELKSLQWERNKLKDVNMVKPKWNLYIESM